MNLNSMDWENALGGEVSINGTAYNAKAGAVVLTDSDDEPIYLQGLHAWEDNVIGRRVSIEGVLHRRSIYPQAQNIDGIRSQGITGRDQWVIEVRCYHVKE